MRKIIVAAAILSTLMCVPSVLAGGHKSPPPGTIRGVVRNATCFGPCQTPSPPLPLYEGDGLVVRIRNVSTGKLVATRHPKNGRFAARVGPGLFRVRATVEPKGNCWQGSHRKVGLVDRGAWVRLTVRNACIL